jgi:hypothetical protein
MWKDDARGAHPECQVAVATKLCTVAPNVCGFSIWNMLYVTFMAPRIFKWHLDSWKICAPRDDAVVYNEIKFYYFKTIHF